MRISFTSFLRDSQRWECIHPVRVALLGAQEKRAGFGQSELRESENLEGATLLGMLIFAYPLGLERWRQPPLPAVHATFLGVLII